MRKRFRCDLSLALATSCSIDPGADGRRKGRMERQAARPQTDAGSEAATSSRESEGFDQRFLAATNRADRRALRSCVGAMRAQIHLF